MITSDETTLNATARRARRARRALRVLAALSFPACASTAPHRTIARPTPSATAASTLPCQPPLPILIPTNEHSKLNLAERFGPYMSQDAVWVPGQPLAVNRDFDFALAMSMDAIGPGLAARKRQDANVALAKRLAELPPLEPNALLRSLCPAPPRTACTALTGKQVRIYRLLFGERSARLQLMLEVESSQDDASRYGAVTEAFPIEALHEPEALSKRFLEAAAQTAVALSSAAATGGATGACKAGDGATFEGRVVTATANHAVLLITEPRPARIVCPTSAFEASQPSAAPKLRAVAD